MDRNGRPAGFGSDGGHIFSVPGCFKKPFKGMFKKKSSSSTQQTTQNGGSTTVTSTSRVVVEESSTTFMRSSDSVKVRTILEDINKGDGAPKSKWLSKDGVPRLPSPTRTPSGAGSRYSPGNEVQAEKTPERETGGRKIFAGGLPSGKGGKFKEVAPPGNEGQEIPAQEGVQDYYKIKAECLQKGVLFEDEDFPAADSSVFYSESNKREIIWKRPKEFTDNPRFFVGGASRFDVKQGELGNCWFLAAVANLTMDDNLFFNVVPKDNSFVEDYTGAFHFRFWRFGRWIDVVVDDRLPCNSNGKLVYMHSEEENEFWSALLEKAYAKVHGSYEALIGGLSSEALQDFSGGIVEIIDIKSCKLDLFTVMEKAQARGSFMGCALKPKSAVKEEKEQIGLVRGHAYSITRVQKVDISTPRKSGKIPLVRIRNPWGNDFEWRGAWSDGSREWQLVSKEEQEKLGVTFEDDGEFWMSMKDFQENYDTLEIVNLSPDAINDSTATANIWHTSYFEGAWIPGATAGGCTNHISLKNPKTFADNPQYVVEFDTPDATGDPEKCTVLFALMQKNRRSKRKEGVKALSIGFTIYELKNSEQLPTPLDTKFFMYHRRTGDSGAYIDMREVSKRLELNPGKYCIIPSSFSPNEDGEFLIRVFSESPNKMIENDADVALGGADEEVEKNTKKEGDATSKVIQDLFKAVAGEDQEIGWAKLKKLLDSYLKKEFEFEGFSREVCRSMVAMVDLDRTGKLGLDEFTDLWTNILRWKTCFKIYDEDNSGNLSAFELRRALNSAGYQVNSRVLQSLVLRYGDDDGNISFEDFIMSCTKLKAMIELYKEKDPDKKNTVLFTLEEWVEKTVYS